MAAGHSTGVGDEGGFAPSLGSNEEALEVVAEAIRRAGYVPGQDILLALDPASTEFYNEGKYVFHKSDGSERTSEQMVDFWEDWTRRYPIVSIEDGLGEDDWDGWARLTARLGDRCSWWETICSLPIRSVSVGVFVPTSATRSLSR